MIDLQGNSGGYTDALTVLYFAFFPGNKLPLLWQARAHPQLEWLVKTAPGELGRTTPPAWAWFNPFIKPDGSAWTSFYGPVEGPRGNYTHASLFNATGDLANAFRHYEPPWAEPPYRPKDIVILTNGACGSACAIFISLLVYEHGVRTVAVGGTAHQEADAGNRQGQGRTRHQLQNLSPRHTRRTAPGPWHRPGRPAAATRDGPEGKLSFNVMNMFPFNSTEDAVPLEFAYEAANCKLFFTWEMMTDITALWRAVALAAWDGGKCVVGSTTESDVTMGGVPDTRRRLRTGIGLGKARTIEII